MAHVPADQRRREFVAAAAKVIAQHGVSGATTRRIAEAAHAPAATLHYCFRNKEEIFYALFKQQAELLEERAELGTRGIGMSVAAAHLLRAILDWYTSEPDYTRAQFELLMWSTRQSQYADLAIRSYEIHVERFAEVLRHGAGDGDDESLAEPVARMLAATADGLSAQWFTFHDEAMLEAGFDMAVEQVDAFLERRRSRRLTAVDS